MNVLFNFTTVFNIITGLYLEWFFYIFSLIIIYHRYNFLYLYVKRLRPSVLIQALDKYIVLLLLVVVAFALHLNILKVLETYFFQIQ